MRCQLFIVLGFAATAALADPPTSAPVPPPGQQVDILRTDETEAAIRHSFSDADNKLLDEIQAASFHYFWTVVGSPAKLVHDRLKNDVSSIAAVGYGLAVLPVAAERKWVSRAEAEERARTVLRHLIEREDNRKWGVYVHFLDPNTGGPQDRGYEAAPSTIDHALLLAGALVAGEYFGGDVKRYADQMAAETDWRKFQIPPDSLLSMAWAPKDPRRPQGEGDLLKWGWWLASDEERLIYFLAVGATNPEHALPPERYYWLQRNIERWKDGPPFAVSWPGNLFTYFFSHCYIDYRSLEADRPGDFGIKDRPRVDWFENSRRAVLTQRQRAIELSGEFKTLGPNIWGLAPCVAKSGYIVPDTQPNLSDKDDWAQGTVAPYAAGCSIMFAPAEAVAALRAMRELKGNDGKPLVWTDPKDGGYGFWDAFNIEQGYVSDDVVGIDHGPLILAIENARTGLIWKLFMQSETAKRAAERLKLERRK